MAGIRIRTYISYFAHKSQISRINLSFGAAELIERHLSWCLFDFICLLGFLNRASC